MFKKLKEKLKGDAPDPTQGPISPSAQYAPPAGPPPGHASSSYSPPQYTPPNQEYAPPTGPGSQYAPPSGPGPQYTPPSGPPPGHGPSSYGAPPDSKSQYPQQPPPSWDPPPYHDWTVIPDTALLPPPPSITYNESPTANATVQDSKRAEAWTRANPLWQPRNIEPAMHAAIQNGQLALLKPPTYKGDLLPQRDVGHWRCRTAAKCRDSSILTNLPVYSVYWDSPLNTQRPKTVYFELKVLGIGRGGFSFEEADAGIAVGFIAPPYPTFRLPGWERGSLGVHGDDGRKYVNNGYGGVDFTTAFSPGETVGIGMTYSIPRNPPNYAQSQQGKILDLEVFFTRNGKRMGEWDGNEELDSRCEGGNIGLRGECDLFAAIGVFGGVEFDVFFHPSQWLYKPY